jgi:hypothetical protein
MADMGFDLAPPGASTWRFAAADASAARGGEWPVKFPSNLNAFLRRAV